MSNVTQFIQSIFPSKTDGQTPIAVSFPAGQSPQVYGVEERTRLKTYQEQPVTVIIDDSISMQGSQSSEATQALKAMLSEFSDKKNKDGFRINLIRFGSQPTLLASNAAPESISASFSGSSGGTVAAPALKMAFDCEKNFTARPDRRRVPGMVIFMSDGALSDAPAALAEASELKKLGVTIISIGFGAGADINTLQQIASSPGHYAYADVGNLVHLFCRVGKTVSLQFIQAQ